MSKRYIPLLSQATKKPRLDTTAQATKRNLSIAPKPPESKPVENLDQFFDDDDDDDLLFATQKIEASVLDFSAITFSEFQHGVKASTQLSNEDEAEKKEEEVIKQDLKDFFMDDDDEWANLEATIDLMPPPAAPPPSVQASKQKESNIRIQYLQDRVQEFSSQNTQLQVNADQYKDKLQCKEGEVTNLREQLKQIKKQMDTLRLEKVQECERIRQKYNQEVHDLKKKLEAEKTDIKFKEHEISRLKVKCLDESQRFNASVVDHKAGVQVPANIFKISLDYQPRIEEIKIPLEVYTDCYLRKTLYASLVNEEYIQLKNTFNNPSQQKVFASLQKVLCRFLSHFELVDKTPLEWQTFQKDGTLFCPEPIYINEKEMQLRRYLALIAIYCRKIPSLCERIIELKDDIILLLKSLGDSFESSAYLGVVESLTKLLIVLVEHYVSKKTPIVSETEDFLFDFLKKIVFCTPNDRVLKDISKILYILSKTHAVQQQICNSLCQKTTLDMYTYDAVQHVYKFRDDTCVLQIYANFLEKSFKDSLLKSDEIFELLKKICWFHGNFLLNCMAKCTDSIANAPHWIVNRESSEVLSSTVSRQDSDVSQASTSSSLKSVNSFDVGGNEKAVCRCFLKAVRSFVVVLYQLVVEWKRRKRGRCKEYIHPEARSLNLIMKKSIDLLFYVFYMFQFDILNNYIKLQNTTRLRIVMQFLDDNQESLDLNEMQVFALKNLNTSSVLRHTSLEEDEEEETDRALDRLDNVREAKSFGRKGDDDSFFRF